MSHTRVRRVALFSIIAAMVATGGTAGAEVSIPSDATYIGKGKNTTTNDGKGTLLHTSFDGKSVEIVEAPFLTTCKDGTEAKRAVYTGVETGVYEIEADGSFTNGRNPKELGDGEVSVAGRFSSDGKKVTVTIVTSANESPSKNFPPPAKRQCEAAKGRFSATLDPASNKALKKVLVTDDFTKATSGFEQVNAGTEFAFYNAPDGEGFTLMTVMPAGTTGHVASARRKPNVKDVVVEADVEVSFGSSGNDFQAGLTCRTTAPNSRPGTEVLGMLDTDGTAYIVQQSDGDPELTRSEGVPVPSLFDQSQLQLTHHLKLVCSGSELSWSVDGTEVTMEARPDLAKKSGRTGLFAEGETANATFTNFVVRKP